MTGMTPALYRENMVTLMVLQALAHVLTPRVKGLTLEYSAGDDVKVVATSLRLSQSSWRLTSRQATCPLVALYSCFVTSRPCLRHLRFLK